MNNIKKLISFSFTLVIILLFASTAQAWHADGHVYCDVNQNEQIDIEDLALENIGVTVNSTTDSFTAMDFTGPDGSFYITLPIYPDSFKETLDEATLPSDAAFVIPAVNEHFFETTDAVWNNSQDWLIDSSICRAVADQCWLTAGGVKFSTTTGSLLDEFNNHGPQHSWGGNVNPACAPNKGHWNHVAHKDKLHFQATDIEVLSCGNVPGIEPGSESPVTPVNFIEFTGPATLKAIKGNKDDFGNVCYFARAEDRNEPGSHGAKDGDDIDRYFLHVYDCNTFETLLLVDVDGDSATVDPLTITGGNMQMHWKPCDN
jgi:hypothetical protein